MTNYDRYFLSVLIWGVTGIIKREPLWLFCLMGFITGISWIFANKITGGWRPAPTPNKEDA